MAHRSQLLLRFLAGLLLFLFLIPPVLAQERFRLVAYNVENLFDLTRNGSEYPDYIPGTGHGWNQATARVKYAHIASVLAGVAPQVAVLSEVETKEALSRLQGALAAAGHPMAHGVISTSPTTVCCAVLSTFPVTGVRELSSGPGRRAILRVTLNVSGTPLAVYANHWRSKQGPESERMAYARALAADLATLPAGTDYILAGDFNSDYNEWQTFAGEPRLNDTFGQTGINHLLQTMNNGAMATEAGIKAGRGRHYDLWMELPPSQRWSHNFFGRKGSLDHILLPAAMYDDSGISYVDGSFARFAPDTLFRDGEIYRWQRTDKGRGRHLGAGYSDHLPICAEFTVGPFVARAADPPVAEKRETAMPRSACTVADLYNFPSGPGNYRISGAVVLYRSGSHAVIKAPKGRAITLYEAGKGLAPGWVVDLTVTRLNDHDGLREVTAVADVAKRGKVDPGPHLLTVDGTVALGDPCRTGEVVGKVCGVYRRGRLHYGGGRSVRVYTVKGLKRPRNEALLCLSRVRIGFHKTPELVVERADQMAGGE